MANYVLPTSVAQAQQLLAAANQRRAQLEEEWLKTGEQVTTQQHLAQTNPNEAVRAYFSQLATRYTVELNTLEAELVKVEDSIAYYQQELKRLQAASGGSTTTAAAAAAAGAAAATAAAKAGVAATPGLPFGLTQNQVLAAIGIPLLIIIVVGMSGSSS